MEKTAVEKKPIKIEKVTRSMVEALIKVVGPLGSMVAELGSVDLSKGRGVLSENEREHCLWTKKGRRITVSVCSDGGVIASVSKEPDPDIPKQGRPWL